MFSFKMNQDLYEKLKAEANQKNMSMAALVLSILKQHATR